MNILQRFSWETLRIGLIKGLKVFFFYLAVLCLFRVAYIGGLASYIGAQTGAADILTALGRGARLSMQTAGVLTLVSAVPAFFLRFFSPRLARLLLLGLNGPILLGLSILFVASFPFYRQFHANFNQMLFTGMNDDLTALFFTMVQQYSLPLRLLAAAVLAAVLWFLLRRLHDAPCPLVHFFGEDWAARALTRVRPVLRRPVRLASHLAFLALCYLVVRLSIFGGSLDWQTAVDWENAGVTRDELLNEAILDYPQAIWRAHELNRRMLACNGLDFTTEDIRLLAAELSHREPDSDNLDDYLTKSAGGLAIERPRHVFVILSESLANWPLLDKYRDIPISDDLRALLSEEDTDYCPTFLPNGASTVSAVTGLVTGFADANLYLTTMPESFEGPYPTAAAPVFSRLGYATNFFYAGPATWERIGAFTKAQGFDRFISRGDFGDVPGSVWGAEDEVFFDQVLSRIDDSIPSFNVLLSASNHSPYDIDLDSKGFDGEAVREALPREHRSDEELLRELGHYWYAQRELSRFVRQVKERYPSSLILIVGDHADRYHIEKQPNTYERYGIPFILTGAGVHKGLLAPNSAGSQIDIVPTLLELIAPKGFSYESVGRSLTRGNDRGVNYGFWLTRKAIGKADTSPLVPEGLEGGEGPIIDDQAMQDYINAVRSISWWRPKYGPMLDEAILEEKGR